MPQKFYNTNKKNIFVKIKGVTMTQKNAIRLFEEKKSVPSGMMKAKNGISR